MNCLPLSTDLITFFVVAYVGIKFQHCDLTLCVFVFVFFSSSGIMSLCDTVHI